MKKLLALCLALLLTIIPFSAFAKGDSSAAPSPAGISDKLQQKLDNLEQKKAENAQRFQTKKEEYAAFKDALKQKHELCFNNRKVNIDLMKDNIRLSQELKASLETIKEKGITLDEETAAKLAELTEQLKTFKVALKDTKGDIKAIMEEYKGFAKDKDYASMDLVFEKIKAIQDFRAEQLKSINNTLKEMITLLASVA